MSGVTFIRYAQSKDWKTKLYESLGASQPKGPKYDKYTFGRLVLFL